jgi:GNAT superfamily N-acetyltransferase
MMEIRVAEVGDAERIAAQRRRMFVAMGKVDDDKMQEMYEAFVPWVRERLADGSYLGWLAWNGEVPVAGAGMYLMDFPPHWRDPRPVRAYLLNFYVEPEERRKGLAFGLLKKVLVEARSRGIRVVSLHASPAGRPLYARMGFEPSNEMMLMMEPSGTA